MASFHRANSSGKILLFHGWLGKIITRTISSSKRYCLDARLFKCSGRTPHIGAITCRSPNTCNLWKQRATSTQKLSAWANVDEMQSTTKLRIKKKTQNRVSKKASSKQQKYSLRRIASPFLQLCHPDKIGNSSHARQVNLHAVQTLNMAFDAVEAIFNSKNSSTTTTAASSPSSQTLSNLAQKLNAEYNIAFMVPTSNNKSNDIILGEEIMYTARSVTMTFPKSITISLQTASTNREVNAAIVSLHRRVINEIGKLLKAAGLPPPLIPVQFDGTTNIGKMEKADVDEIRFRREIGIGDEEDFRANFTIDWEREAQKYRVAVKKMQADLATMGMTDDRRKRHLIAGVLARMRFLYVGRNDIIDSIDDEEISQGGIGLAERAVEQLITARRISLLLEHNFDELGIEDNGRLWEEIVIVLAEDSFAKVYQGGESRRQRKRRGESGYKFALDGDGIMTVTVPASFTDEQFFHEFEHHLKDF